MRVALKKLGYTRKKQTKYREQDEKKVNVYLKKLSEAGSDREIIYIDETGFDEYYYREYGWNKRGIYIEGKKRGFRYSRINLVAGKVGNTLIEYDIQGNNGKWIFWRMVQGNTFKRYWKIREESSNSDG